MTEQTAPPTVHERVNHPVLRNDERQRCEIYTRIMGYLRPVSEWNAGKQAEYRERLPYRPALQKKMEAVSGDTSAQDQA